MTEKSRRFKIPRLYKTILALTVVIGPFSWLMFTEDGQRRADLMILAFKDSPFIEMRLDTLASSATESQVREFLPDVVWQCQNNRTPFGERNCVTPIGAFNDTPAHYVVMYFENDALQAMKIVYRGRYHDYLLSLTETMLGEPAAQSGVLEWKTDRGVVVMQERVSRNEAEPSLFWMAADYVRKRGDTTND